MFGGLFCLRTCDSSERWTFLPFSKTEHEAAAQHSPAQSERKNRSSSVRQFSAFTAARQGPILPPLTADAACRGSEGDPDARRTDGAPQQARTSPGRNGREGPRRRPARHAADGVQPNSRDNFRVTAKRGVRGAGGVEGSSPLTPCPAPGRRPAARAGQKPRCTEGHRLNTTRTFYLFKVETL